MPAPEALSLYRSLLRYGSKFTNYNIREYVKRKTKQDFRAHQHETSTQAVKEFLSKAKEDLEVVKRQVMVYSMYARKHKSIMDIPLTQVLREQAEIPAEQLRVPGP